MSTDTAGDHDQDGTVVVTVPAYALRVDVAAWASEYGIDATPGAVHADAAGYYRPGAHGSAGLGPLGQSEHVRIVADASDVPFGSDCVSRITQPDPLGNLKLVCTVCRDELDRPVEVCSVEVDDQLSTLVTMWLYHAAAALALREAAR